MTFRLLVSCRIVAVVSACRRNHRHRRRRHCVSLRSFRRVACCQLRVRWRSAFSCVHRRCASTTLNYTWTSTACNRRCSYCPSLPGALHINSSKYKQLYFVYCRWIYWLASAKLAVIIAQHSCVPGTGVYVASGVRHLHVDISQQPSIGSSLGYGSRSRHVTPKGQGHDPNNFQVVYLHNRARWVRGHHHQHHR